MSGQPAGGVPNESPETVRRRAALRAVTPGAPFHQALHLCDSQQIADCVQPCRAQCVDLPLP
jgi:hypothetical protein